MKLTVLVVFVCVANAYSAAVNKDETDSIPQLDLQDELVRQVGNDDGDDVSFKLRRSCIYTKEIKICVLMF